jgi:hypothetical protein
LASHDGASSRRPGAYAMNAILPVSVLRSAWARWNERRQRRRFEDAACRTLRELDDRTLRDLGLDRSQIGTGLFRADPVDDPVPPAESSRPTPFRPRRMTARVAAALEAVVVALSLAGAQLGLADHYAGWAEASTKATSAEGRLAFAQMLVRHAVR